MKKILVWLFFVLAFTAGVSAYGEVSTSEEESLEDVQDSSVCVIGFFNKYDTATYWVEETAWKIDGTDSVCSAYYSMKVRLNVVDSTAKGYKMEYTFLEFPEPELSDSASVLERFQKEITAKYAQKIVGTTVRFETDEYGAITKYNNLSQIKKQAKSLYKNVLNDLYELPEIKEMKKVGFDIKDYAKKIDTDKLIDGYLEEITLLFLNHGKCINTGEFTEHEDATDTQFETTTYIAASEDTVEGLYHVVYDVVSVVPQKLMKELVGGIVDAFSNDSVTKSFNENFDAQVNTDGTYEEYLQFIYTYSGLPCRVVKQESTMIENAGKLKQKIITIDSFSSAQ